MGETPFFRITLAAPLICAAAAVRRVSACVRANVDKSSAAPTTREQTTTSAGERGATTYVAFLGKRREVELALGRLEQRHKAFDKVGHYCWGNTMSVCQAVSRARRVVRRRTLKILSCVPALANCAIQSL